MPKDTNLHKAAYKGKSNSASNPNHKQFTQHQNWKLQQLSHHHDLQIRLPINESIVVDPLFRFVRALPLLATIHVVLFTSIDDAVPQCWSLCDNESHHPVAVDLRFSVVASANELAAQQSNQSIGACRHSIARLVNSISDVHAAL